MNFFKRVVGKMQREFIRLKKGRLEILLYHFVTANENLFVGSSNVPPNVFREQMHHISEHYRVIPLHHALDIIASDGKDGPYVAVCFDDGYANNITEAYPILEEFKVPATLFICPSILDNQDLLWREKIRYIIHHNLVSKFIDFLQRGERARKYNFKLLEQMNFYRWSKEPTAITDMSIQTDLNAFFESEHISTAALATQYNLYTSKKDAHERTYLDFGNHTLTHPLLPCLNYAQQEVEICASDAQLKLLGITPYALAAPFAAYNADTIAICKQLGYRFIFDDGMLSNLTGGTPNEFRVLHRKLAPATLAQLRAII